MVSLQTWTKRVSDMSKHALPLLIMGILANLKWCKRSELMDLIHNCLSPFYKKKIIIIIITFPNLLCLFFTFLVFSKNKQHEQFKSSVVSFSTWQKTNVLNSMPVLQEQTCMFAPWKLTLFHLLNGCLVTNSTHFSHTGFDFQLNRFVPKYLELYTVTLGVELQKSAPHSSASLLSAVVIRRANW